MSTTDPHMLVTDVGLADDDDPREPESPKVGRYVLADRLGTGGMGSVFLAHDPELGRAVAIKLLHAREPGELAHARLLREAQAMAKLSHPNVVAVYDVGSFGREVFLAMEYMDGGSLHAWLDERPRRWQELVPRFCAAGRGLAAAHAVGIIHRDFKPANVLLNRDGQVKVTDFGLARAEFAAATVADGEAVSASASASGSGSVEGLSLTGSGSGNAFDLALTQVGTTVGTPAFMAPEQARCEPTDARSDQFSFCVALYEALWRAPPFEGDRPIDRMRALIADRRRPRPSDVEVPGWLAAIVERGLAPAPADRWPSMDALVEALSEDVLGRRRRRRRIALGVGFSLALVAGLWGRQRWLAASCDEAAGAAQRIWADDAARLRASAAASGQGERVDAAVADWIARWSDARRGVCMSRDLDEGSRRQTDGCLDQQLAAFAGLVTVFDERAGEAGAATNSLAAIASLPEPAVCADPRRAVAFEFGVTCPESLTLGFHRLRALELAGLYADARTLAEALREEVSASACPELEDRVDVSVARLDLIAGEFEQNRPRLERALRRAGARDDLPAALAAAHALAELERRAGSPDGARVWLELAAMFVERLGARPSDVVELRLARAHLHRSNADYERAELELDGAQTLLDATLGDQHPSYVELLSLRGKLLQDVGRYETAIAQHEQARSLALRLFGPEHPRVLSSTLDLARGLLASQPERSVALQSDAVALSERIYGPAHSNTAMAIEQLATGMMMTGELAGAQLEFEDAIARFERLGVATDRDRARLGHALVRYGSLLRRRGALEQAEATLTRAVELLADESGVDDIGVGPALINLANVVDQRGRPAEALELQRRALRAYEAVEPDTETVALVLDNVGLLELQLGRTHEALLSFERALAIVRAVLPEQHPTQINYQLNVALALTQLGEHERAEAAFARGLAGCREHHPAGLDECAELEAGYAGVLLDAPEPRSAEALAHAERAVAALARVNEPYLRAELLFTHARALRSTGAEARGREQAEAALRELGDSRDGRFAELRATIDAWLRAN